MAYSLANLSLARRLKGNLALWTYISSDSLATIAGANYFDNAASLMREGDLIFTSGNAVPTVYVVSDITAGAVTIVGISAAGFQPLDAELTAIAGVTSAADKVPYFTGAGTAAVADFSSAGRALVDDADASAQRTTLGLVIDTNVAATSFKTIAVSGQSDVVADSATDTLTLAAGSNITLTTNAGTDTVTIAASGSTGYGTIQEEGSGLTQRAILNFVGAGITAADDAGNTRTNVTLDSELNALAGLTSAADKVPYFTGSGTAAVADFTSAARSLADDASVAAMRATLELTDGAIEALFEGGGSALTTGVKLDLVVPYACTITGWWLLADQAGDLVIDVWKDSYANFPPTIADTIAGSEKPTLSAAAKNQDTSLSSWTTSLAKGDILRFNIDSAATVTRALLYLPVTR